MRASSMARPRCCGSEPQRHINEHGDYEVATLAHWPSIRPPIRGGRRSSFQGFRGSNVGCWTTVSELVKPGIASPGPGLRQLLAQGAENERMTPGRSHILDDFIARTEMANARSLAELKATHGEDALKPWNLRFFASGAVVRRMDEYMPFGLALRRWVESFRRLGIRYRGATLQLDLMERPGKHQNGFCHSPIPTWVNEKGEWLPGQINFTAEAARPGGQRYAPSTFSTRRPHRTLTLARTSLYNRVCTDLDGYAEHDRVPATAARRQLAQRCARMRKAS